MLTRRAIVSGFAALGAAGPARAQAVLTDDGIYRQPWFLESFLELGDDLQGATNAGKRFAIMWELRGCPYCKRNASGQFRAAGYRGRSCKANFEILQLNIVGVAQGDGFRRRARSPRRLLRRNTACASRRPPVLPRAADGLAARGAGRARGRARAGLSASRTISSRCFASCARRATRRRAFATICAARGSENHPTFIYAKPLPCSSATVATPDGTNLRNASLRVLAGSMFCRL